MKVVFHDFPVTRIDSMTYALRTLLIVISKWLTYSAQTPSSVPYNFPSDTLMPLHQPALQYSTFGQSDIVIALRSLSTVWIL